MNEDMNEYEDFTELPEEYFGVLAENLPSVVEDWTKTALTVSHNNEVPAQMAYFVTLGQILKDFIRMPRGANTEDTRVHFCWIQTSGTGKSTLYNFLGPVTKQLNKKINDFEGTHCIVEDADGNQNYTPNFYTIFDVVEYTDAALIGYYDKVRNPGYDKDDPLSDEFIFKRISGSLEGNGLARWDEFEYSGVFKQSQHKENIIVYLNTLMNTLEGESWIITKKLKEGHLMECKCQRSVWSTTYVPKHLKTVIAEKGVLQRMLVYVREVPEQEQHDMRMTQLKKSGKRETISLPTEKFTEAFFTLYKNIKERYLEVGEDPFATMEYSEGFADALILEYGKMREYIANCSPQIREIAQNFMTRMNVILMKLSVLCCVANSPQIKDPTKKYIVTPAHVRQAYILTQQCYSTLVEWLERSLKVKKSVLVADKSTKFVDAYNEMDKDEQGYVSKPQLFKETQARGLSRAQCFRDWKVIESKFEIDSEGRSILVRLKKTGDEKQ